MTTNAENGGAAYLPAQGFGFHAAKINAHGGKEALSDAVYDSPEDAEAGALSILMSIEAHEKRVQEYEDMARKKAVASEVFLRVWFSFIMAVGFCFGARSMFELSRKPGDVAEVIGYFFAVIAATCLFGFIVALLDKDVRRAAFGKGTD